MLNLLNTSVHKAYNKCAPVSETAAGDDVLEHKPRVKRPLEECEGGEGEGGEEEMEVMEEGGEGRNNRTTKRARAEESGVGTDSDGAVQNSSPDMNFPLPGETGLPCLVKVSQIMHRMSV